MNNINQIYHQNTKSILLLVFYFFSFFSIGQTIKITSDSLGYILEYQSDSLIFEKQKEGGFIPLLENATYFFEKGFPELTKYSQSFLIPQTAIIHSEILEEQINEISIEIAPSLGMIYQNESIPLRKKGEIYTQNTFYPKEQIKIHKSVTTHQGNRQHVWVQPLQYNPITKKLKHYTFLKIRLFFEKPIQQVQKRIAKTTALNSLQKNMLIFAPDSFYHRFKEFRKWKHQLGINTIFCSTDSLNTTTKIKNVIKEYYHQQKVDFVLLGGTANLVPSVSSFYGISDYSYGLLEGNDAYAEVFVGRFPANNQQELSIVIQKTIAYEQAKKDASWVKKVLSIASDEGNSDIGDNGETDYEHLSLLNQKFEKNTFQSDIIYQANPVKQSISKAINQGVNYLFYAGHGIEKQWQSVPYTTDSIFTLQNYEHFPVIINAACLNGNLLKSNTLAETFLTASNENKPIGATAMYSSSIVQLWAPPMLGQDLFYKYLIENKESTLCLSSIMMNSFYDIIDHYGDGGKETVYTWILFGDPSLNLWSQNPQSLTLTTPSKFDLSLDTFVVQGTEGAKVTLVSDGELIAFGEIKNGKLSLSKKHYQVRDSVTITISKKDYQILQKIIPLFSDKKAYYFIDDMIISDDNNKLPENNEWIQISPIIHNFGELAGHNISVKIKVDTSLFIVKKDRLFLESINGLSTNQETVFEIKTKYFLKDQLTSIINFEVIDSLKQVNSNEFYLKINAPELSYEPISINGLAQENYYLITSDTIIIKGIIKNTGHSYYKNSKASLELNDVYIQPYVNEIIIDSLAAKSMDTCVFKIPFSSQISEGMYFKATWFWDTIQYQTLTFFYKQNADFILGDGLKKSVEYPFYNYYKANHSLFYYEKELFTTPILIDSIGFYVDYVSNNTLSREFNDLSIKVGEKDWNTIDVLQPNLKEIFFKKSHTLINQKGWQYFDVDDFQFENKNDFVIDILWGKNTYSCNYNDSYILKSHQTDSISMLFGYSDTDNQPKLVGKSNIRPDIRIVIHPVILSKCKIEFDASLQSNDTLILLIGTEKIYYNTKDSNYLSLSKGVYSYAVLNQKLDTLFTSEFNVQLLNETFLIKEKSQTTNLANSITNTVFLSQSNDNLLIHGLSSSFEYQIVNTKGQVFIQSSMINQEKIDISFLISDLYILKIMTNQTSQSFRFVIH